MRGGVTGARSSQNSNKLLWNIAGIRNVNFHSLFSPHDAPSCTVPPPHLPIQLLPNGSPQLPYPAHGLLYVVQCVILPPAQKAGRKYARQVGSGGGFGTSRVLPSQAAKHAGQGGFRKQYGVQYEVQYGVQYGE